MTFSFTAPRVDVRKFIRENESMTKKEKAIADKSILGSLAPIEETSKILNLKLRDLNKQLDVETQRDKYAFNLAQQRIPEFANSIEFRLMFLRASRFDVELAAEKIINYWETKLDLFGPDIAFRPDGRICLSDLSESDLETLESSGLFCLPKDKSNRGILFSRRQNWNVESSGNSLARLMWYLLQVITEDPEVQKNGVVLILNNIGEFSVGQYDRIAEAKFRDIVLAGYPCYIAGVHLCFNSKVYELVLPFVLYLFTRELRSRLRLHGYSFSLAEDLAEYGITEDILPPGMGGKFLIEVDTWKREREEVEKSLARSSLKRKLSLKSQPDFLHLQNHSRGTRAKTI